MRYHIEQTQQALLYHLRALLPQSA
jgi:hypothetical protein